MWIKPGYDGTLEELNVEVKTAIVQFEKDLESGKAVPAENDEKSWGLIMKTQAQTKKPKWLKSWWRNKNSISKKRLLQLVKEINP